MDQEETFLKVEMDIRQVAATLAPAGGKVAAKKGLGKVQATLEAEGGGHFVDREKALKTLLKHH